MKTQLHFIKKLLLTVGLVVMGTQAFSYEIIGTFNGDDFKAWSVRCDNGWVGTVQYSYRLKQYHATSQGIYPYYSSFEEAAKVECGEK